MGKKSKASNDECVENNEKKCIEKQNKTLKARGSKRKCSKNELISYINNLKYNDIDGFTLHTMPSDGNCMFHSIAHQMNYVSNNYQLKSNVNARYTHVNVREKVCEYISNHQQYFSKYLDLEKETFKQYYERMSAVGTWGDHLELFAASQLYNIQIHVLQCDTLGWTSIVDGGNRSERVPSRRRIREMYVSRHGKSHFNSLIPNSITSRNMIVTADALGTSSESLVEGMSESMVMSEPMAKREPDSPVEAVSESMVEPGSASVDVSDIVQGTAHMLINPVSDTVSMSDRNAAVDETADTATGSVSTSSTATAETTPPIVPEIPKMSKKELRKYKKMMLRQKELDKKADDKHLDMNRNSGDETGLNANADSLSKLCV